MTGPKRYDDLGEAILGSARRATLPFEEAEGHANYGTAFWYNHLVEDTPEREVYVEYLVTAEALTGIEYADFTLRAEVADPAPSADHVIVTEFAAGWTRLPRVGVAVMPATILHAYADRKGWKWDTDQITDGLAAREADVATIGRTPVDACVVGHDLGAAGEREQALVVGSVALDQRGRLRWTTRMPPGCVGAPVFTTIPVDDRVYKLVCLGVVLPGEGYHEIASFDRIRTEVAALVAPPSRPWWKRRKG